MLLFSSGYWCDERLEQYKQYTERGYWWLAFNWIVLECIAQQKLVCVQYLYPLKKCMSAIGKSYNVHFPMASFTRIISHLFSRIATRFHVYCIQCCAMQSNHILYSFYCFRNSTIKSISIPTSSFDHLHKSHARALTMYNGICFNYISPYMCVSSASGNYTVWTVDKLFEFMTNWCLFPQILLEMLGNPVCAISLT